MAKMDELYNDMFNYCEENNCWKIKASASDWNGMLGTNYGSAAFTALANAGRIEKDKAYKAKSYLYNIVPTGKIKEMMEATKREKEIEDAKYVVEHYEEAIAARRARYEEAIANAKRQLELDLEWENEKLAKANAVLGL